MEGKIAMDQNQNINHSTEQNDQNQSEPAHDLKQEHKVYTRMLSDRKFNQLQSYTLPLAGLLMIVGLTALFFS